ncbi:hypothetical protein [Hymenobacter perfusus]|uniref:Peptidase A2 domain-containing protein n=1 Tax=Hymenobacter perfusus TaxID=1236770 RepID=A0A3R9NNR5_9BACT|nr:hypothetical protein [Hymenobacter perfusus]RSK40137.1 hypothetical protein EI293_19395 [Hymenobacter perfusus]
MLLTFRKLLLAATVALGGCTAQKQALSTTLPSYPWFSFTWATATVEGRKFDKVALMVPVKINDLRGNFTTQFDLGSDATLLYENALRSYFPGRRQLYALVDTTQRGINDNGVVNFGTTGLPVTMGGATIPHPRLMVGHGDAVPPDSLYTSSEKLIGSIGSDFLAGKVLIIDYPQRRMCVLDSVDAYWRGRTTFVASRLKNGRMHIPVTVGPRTYWTLFDTGASIFPLNTDYATWQSLTGTTAVTDSMRLPSWGEMVWFYGAPMPQDAYLGTLKLPKSVAWYNRNPRLTTFNKAEQIDALTGNVFFINNTVVLDFKRRQFGVVK